MDYLEDRTLCCWEALNCTFHFKGLHVFYILLQLSFFYFFCMVEALFRVISTLLFMLFSIIFSLFIYNLKICKLNISIIPTVFNKNIHRSFETILWHGTSKIHRFSQMSLLTYNMQAAYSFLWQEAFSTEVLLLYN